MDSTDKLMLAQLEDKLIDTVTSYVKKNITGKYTVVLSGGFDSGFLAAITKPVNAIRMHFPYGTVFDESRYAYAVAKHLDLDLQDVTVTPENFKENFAEAVKVMGEVTSHFSLVPLYMLMKSLKEKGVTDVISGEGPDEYLGGYARQIIFDELIKLYGIAELRNYRLMINKVLGIHDHYFGELVFLYGQTVGYSMEEIGNFLKEDKTISSLPFQGIIGKMDMTLGKIEKMEQKMAEHFGIKFHYPYINDELASFCYSLPDSLKIRDGVTKWGFRQICKKYLPAMMMDRSKMGGPVAPVNDLMGWDLGPFDKSKYLEEQEKILNEK